MKRIKLIVTSFVLFFCNFSWGQQDSQFTQYMYNTTNLNPAYAGSRGVMSIFGSHRNQWIGIDGAPVTNMAAFNAPLNDTRLGIGMSILNDRIGPMVDNNISADLSYTVDINYDYKLAFGLKAGANMLNVDFTKLNIYDPYDPRFQHDIDNKFSPNIGAGVYLYSDNFYAGISAPRMLRTSYYDKMAGEDAKDFVVNSRMDTYLMTGLVFDIDYNIKLKTSLLAKVASGAPVQTDIAANLMFNEKFTAGLSYRWSASLSAMVGFQVSDGLLIGYSYDAETTKLANYNSGSHEIFLRFELFDNYERIVSPRYF
ncbi:type IX secretion system membrane protein PorP/SprF [Flavobacterium sp. DG2-3]|uniref:PorP/SprF family type IX secretion system membrane protein n=1 Tax=Flavobacterium sp. DG2-3 TaxID=3068317 RepID=UPI00273E31B4|nr:type IX secretion system membrane protein PorP/SprF [Flavobacterium sp. DG2-3]MDP5199132.1 type IX secretion system membrane protein PorP/SprF [Flavobacterium sp. DG2-3]